MEEDLTVEEGVPVWRRSGRDECIQQEFELFFNFNWIPVKLLQDKVDVVMRRFY